MDHCLVLYRFSESDQPSYFEQFKLADLSEVKNAIETISTSLISTLSDNGIKIDALYLVEGKYEIVLLIEVPDADTGGSISTETTEKLSFTFGETNVTPTEFLPCWLVGHA
jgi:hypothetical protein